MNGIAEGLVDHIMPGIHNTRVVEEDEVEELFNEVFGAGSNDMI